jgi:hypothetical protein
MTIDASRRAALVGLRDDHYRVLHREANRLRVPRSRLLEALLDFALESLRNIDDDELIVRMERPKLLPEAHKPKERGVGR